MGTDDVDDEDDDLLEKGIGVDRCTGAARDGNTDAGAREEINGEVLFRLEFFTIAIMGADAAADAMFFSSIRSESSLRLPFH